MRVWVSAGSEDFSEIFLLRDVTAGEINKVVAIYLYVYPCMKWTDGCGWLPAPSRPHNNFSSFGWDIPVVDSHVTSVTLHKNRPQCMCIKKVDTPHCLKQQMLGDGTYMKEVLRWFDPMQAPTPNFLVTEQISQELPKQPTLSLCLQNWQDYFVLASHTVYVPGLVAMRVKLN